MSSFPSGDIELLTEKGKRLEFFRVKSEDREKGLEVAFRCSEMKKTAEKVKSGPAQWLVDRYKALSYNWWTTI